MINSREVVISIGLVVIQTQIQFQTVVGVETMLIGEFCTVTATKSTTDTDPILCVHGKSKTENSNQKKHYFLHSFND